VPVLHQHFFPLLPVMVEQVQGLEHKGSAALSILGADVAGVMLDDSDNGPGLAEIRVIVERSRYGTGANA